MSRKMKNDVLLDFVKKEMLAGNTKCRVIQEKIKKELGLDVSTYRIYKRIDKCYKPFKPHLTQKKTMRELSPNGDAPCKVFIGKKVITPQMMNEALMQIHKIICKCAENDIARTPTIEEANDIYAWCCYGLNIGEGKGEE